MAEKVKMSIEDIMREAVKIARAAGVRRLQGPGALAAVIDADGDGSRDDENPDTGAGDESGHSVIVCVGRELPTAACRRPWFEIHESEVARNPEWNGSAAGNPDRGGAPNRLATAMVMLYELLPGALAPYRSDTL